jgi:hypothetical protein
MTRTVPPPVTPAPIVPLPDTLVTAKKPASIFAYALRDQTSDERGTIAQGEEVVVLGRTRLYDGNWAYVHQAGEDVDGYAYAPVFEWPTLEVINVTHDSFYDDQGEKWARFLVEVRGGDGAYTFYWGDQKVPTLVWGDKMVPPLYWGAQEVPSLDLHGSNVYRIYWPWGVGPIEDTLKVESGVEQEALWPHVLTVQEPSYSP